MSKTQIDLTGVWHGLYSYDQAPAPVYFVATLMNGLTWISGTSHEAINEIPGQDLTLFATLQGSLERANINFIKVYDGSGGWDHSVPYVGCVNEDGNEIEGTWSIVAAGYAPTSGRFLMIRNREANEAVVRKAFEIA